MKKIIRHDQRAGSLRDKLLAKGWVTEFSVDTLVALIESHYCYQEAMLDQAMQAAETLRDCWLERSLGLLIEDDPWVEDACSVIESIRTERNRLP